VNVFWALGSLLGLNLCLLAGPWLCLPANRAQPGRLWLWLSERLARDAKAAQLAPALLVLQRQRLNRWAARRPGQQPVVAGDAGALACCWRCWRPGATASSGKPLLGAEPFIALTQALGALPSLLGFAVPTRK
jgi:hypothetical protein